MMLENSKKDIKKVNSKDYNYEFNRANGWFKRWGQTEKDDPAFSPFGPEIADIEISTICSGVGKPCEFCYKSNGPIGNNMSLETFKKVFDNLPKNLTQIAFGIGDIDANPDLFSIMQYCRDNGVVPNITINGFNLTDQYAQKLKDLCGAVAVSRYDSGDVCYDAVKKLTDIGMNQINIHMLVAEETSDACIKAIDDIKTDPRLSKLNAIVFLSLKPKGRGATLSRISDDKFKNIIKYAMEKGISYGFDSCTAPKFLDAIKGHKYYKLIEQLSEPCESCLFSTYINVDGKMFPCSFTEEGNGIDLTVPIDFIKDVWYNPIVEDYRNKILTSKDQNNCRKCFKYEV